MTKKISFGVVGFLFLVSPLFVSAQSTDVQAQIAALLAQIKQLQALIIQLQGGQSASCVSVSQNLTLGSTGSDVTKIQNYLIAKGHLDAQYNTGYYGFLTAQAVGKLQIDLGIVSSANDTAYGIMGPKSRSAVGCSESETKSVSATTPPVQSSTSGQVQAQDISIGTGKAAVPGSKVSVTYVGKLSNGTVFDSSTAKGNVPLQFTLGDQGIIQGFHIGVNGMREGGKRLVTIPPSLGYGSTDVKDANGNVIIPANSILIFEMTLVSVVGGTATNAPTLTFTTSPAQINAGDSHTLSWSSTNTTSCGISVDGVLSSNESVSDTKKGILYKTTTLDMFCNGPGGTVAKSVTVTVNDTTANVPTITVLPPNGGVSAKFGSMYTLSWNAQNLSADARLAFGLISSNGTVYRIKDGVIPATSGSFQWTMNGVGCWGTQCAENAMKIGDSFRAKVQVYTPAGACYDNQWSGGTCPSGTPVASIIAEDQSTQTFTVVQ